MANLTLSREDVTAIQKAHARVQILEEMYSDNSKDDALRQKILDDLSDAKLNFETVKETLVVSKLPVNSNWSLDYASGVVSY